MRIRIQYRPYLYLIGFLFFLLSLPEVATEKFRRVAVSSIAPSWRGLHFLKMGTLKLLMITPPGGRAESGELTAEIEALKRENQLLRGQLANVREWLVQEERVDEQLNRWKALSHNGETDPSLNEFYKRRALLLKATLDLQLRALPAKVIFREPASWGRFLWLDVGESHNRVLKRRVVAKNSPVVVGASLVGVVEEVAEKKCRVRLITDAGLVPSVRAARGQEQNHFLMEHLQGVILALRTRGDLFASKEKAEELIAYLSRLKAELSTNSQDLLLAKGELYGTSQPLWRSRDPILRGVGFNYDYADDEGISRDLRTGEMIGSKRKAEPILKVGDLLITTGMDGIFPMGLRVGIVSQVMPLQEGACSYEISAKTTCGNLDHLSYLTVLPPTSK